MWTKRKSEKWNHERETKEGNKGISVKTADVTILEEEMVIPKI